MEVTLTVVALGLMNKQVLLVLIPSPPTGIGSGGQGTKCSTQLRHRGIGQRAKVAHEP